jgi:hypothetical protein
VTQFTPFNDSPEPVYIPTDDTTGGIDTREIDAYRQGVEIRTNHQRFIGNQPKIWAGSLDHVVSTTTIGQARSFVEYENSLLFEDLPEFSPVSYIELGFDYPLPIVLNDGPQQEEEAYMEPFTIPFRKYTPEGPFFARRVAASLEDGNNFDTVFGNANRVAQFQSYQDPLQNRFFLDEGGSAWGDGSIENQIITPAYIANIERLLRGFDDTTIDDVPQSLQATSDMEQVLISMKMNLDMDLRPARARSANANTFVYGRDSGNYGTDSITFIGRTRGS